LADISLERHEDEFPSALVLAGGLGTRLRPAFAGGPKALAPVQGKPFLDYLLRWLALSGVRNAILCVGYKASHIQDYARSGEGWGLDLHYSVEDKLLGTGGAIKKAETLISGDHIFVINGDTYLDVSLEHMLAYHLERKALATIATPQVRDTLRYGSVELDERGRVVAFREKGSKTQAPDASGSSEMINGGVYVLSRQCLAGVRPKCEVSFEREVLPNLIATKRVFGFRTNGYFLDIGVESDYNRAQTELREQFSNRHPH
jgi:D-glycero-alpha-D-manno-heptose 1-phosphate guanylyltransferase